MPKEKKDKEKKLKDTTSYIRNEGDEPMDLLSRSIAGNVASEYFLFTSFLNTLSGCKKKSHRVMGLGGRREDVEEIKEQG